MENGKRDPGKAVSDPVRSGACSGTLFYINGGSNMAYILFSALHADKKHSIAWLIHNKTDYVKDPEKTENGELVTGYCCDPVTVDEEFMLQRRLYHHINGTLRADDVIAYQIIQSFKPGEIAPEDANRLGHELVLKFTKGDFSFIVATHTDRPHIHNHIIFNSVAMDGSKKFRDFIRSGYALWELSNQISLEHGLSIIEQKPFSQRKKKRRYPQKETVKSRLCEDIKEVLKKKPKDFPAFLSGLRSLGYEIREGEYISVRAKDRHNFIRLSSLPEGYCEDDVRKILLEQDVRNKKRISIANKRSANIMTDSAQKPKKKGQL
ncbi:MAG: relaxase/mobilization nuclease domain-containing protein, partial [Lachnospiraceae bacterium]|nr:relaxase/mobilization nuclease domain-containing protein [Lachnospiraceae bacterium]